MIKKNLKKNINIIANSSKTLDHFSRSYIDYLNNLLLSIDSRKLNNLSKILLTTRRNKGTIFVIGNGGSAATASSMANDLGFDIIKKTRTNKPFKFISLTDNSPVLTAISNDTGYENVFLNQLKIHFKKGDIVIMISASGNSKNLLLAANWIKKKGGTIFSLLGFDGGKLKKLSNDYMLIKSAKGDYGPVEDSHLIINHILAHWFQKILKN